MKGLVLDPLLCKKKLDGHEGGSVCLDLYHVSLQEIRDHLGFHPKRRKKQTKKTTHTFTINSGMIFLSLWGPLHFIDLPRHLMLHSQLTQVEVEII